MAGMHPEELELLAYLEGELDDSRRAEVASHLEACDRCAQEVRSVEAGRAALRSAPMLELPSERLEATLTGLPPRAVTPPGVIRRALPIAAALAAVAALAGGAFVLGTIDGGDDESASAPAQGEASDASGGGEVAPTTGGATTDKRQSAEQLFEAANVAGSPATVARRLRRDGLDARAVDGRVIVRGATATEVRKALATLDTGPVRVVIRP
jgi:anti-sigma factor RsiW